MSFYGNIIKHLEKAFNNFQFKNYNNEIPITYLAENDKDMLTFSAGDRWLNFKQNNQKISGPPENTEYSQQIDIYHSDPDSSKNSIDKNNLNISSSDISDGATLTLTSSLTDNKGHSNGNINTHVIFIDITKAQNKISNNQMRLTQLEGQDQGKTVRKIANEELTKQLIPSNAKEAMDTLQEISNWIQQHPDEASAMNTNITINENNIRNHGERIQNLEGLSPRVDVLEEQMKTGGFTLQQVVANFRFKHVYDSITSILTLEFDLKTSEGGQ